MRSVFCLVEPHSRTTSRRGKSPGAAAHCPPVATSRRPALAADFDPDCTGTNGHRSNPSLAIAFDEWSTWGMLDELRTRRWIPQLPDSFGLAVFLMATLVIATLGAGCDTKGEEQAERPLTPLDCDKSKGEYFDPLLERCRDAQSAEDAYVLAAYRRLLEFGGTQDSIECQVFLRSYVTPSEYVALLETLRIVGVTALALRFPDVQGGTSISSMFDQPVEVRDSPSLVLADTLSDKYMSETLGVVLSVAFAEGRFRIWSVRVLTSAPDIAQWWVSNWDSIRIARPLVDFFDRAQIDYCPECVMP